MKWIVLLNAVMISVAIAGASPSRAACGHGHQPPCPTPTPTATPTTTPTPTPTATPTSTPYPSTYFNGPLGNNNVLPADPGGALVAVWPGWTGATSQNVIDRLTQLQAAAGLLDIIAVHYGGGGTYGGQGQCAYLDDDPIINWAIANGSIPYLTWTPNRWSSNSDSVAKQIINGNRDACLDAIADHLKNFTSRIMLRPLHEFDFLQYFRRADSSLDYATDSTQGQAVIDAFRHIVGRFQARGASNVGFIWCPDEGGGSRSMVGLAYPGNTYVDWTCSDRYNRASSTAYSGCAANGWVDFYRIFNHLSTQCSGQQNYHDRFAKANGKPFFVGETSTRYDSATPSRKNTWYMDIAKAKDPADSLRYMSNLIGVDTFDQYILNEGQPGNLDNDWRIDSNQTDAMYLADQLGAQSNAYGLTGWSALATDPRWNTGVAP